MEVFFSRSLQANNGDEILQMAIEIEDMIHWQQHQDGKDEAWNDLLSV